MKIFVFRGAEREGEGEALTVEAPDGLRVRQRDRGAGTEPDWVPPRRSGYRRRGRPGARQGQRRPWPPLW